MITVRQIERSWSSQQYQRLFQDLVAARTEGQFRIPIGPGPLAAAAMAIIRMDELDQSHAPLYGQLVRYLLGNQDADGGWGDLMVTALCVRALLCGQGGGLAVERGLHFLADLQKPQGIWPNVPVRRMNEDAYVSAFILYQLGDNPAFQSRVRFEDAIRWFEQHETTMEDQARRLWERAALRCRPRRQSAAVLWS